MKKRTSKSASAIRGTSSPSGTSGKTDATAGKSEREERNGHGPFDFVVQRLRKMGPKELRDSLVAAGIIDAEGHLQPKYQSVKSSSAE